jgi:predicted  nucleic acid-binding Zn-ribbon protein
MSSIQGEKIFELQQKISTLEAQNAELQRMMQAAFDRAAELKAQNQVLKEALMHISKEFDLEECCHANDWEGLARHYDEFASKSLTLVAEMEKDK